MSYETSSWNTHITQPVEAYGGSCVVHRCPFCGLYTDEDGICDTCRPCLTCGEYLATPESDECVGCQESRRLNR